MYSRGALFERNWLDPILGERFYGHVIFPYATLPAKAATPFSSSGKARFRDPPPSVRPVEPNDLEHNGTRSRNLRSAHTPESWVDWQVLSGKQWNLL